MELRAVSATTKGRVSRLAANSLKRGAGTTANLIASDLRALEHRLARPIANRHLPVPLRIDEIKGWLQIETGITRLKDCEWITELDPEVAAVLEALIDAVEES